MILLDKIYIKYKNKFCVKYCIIIAQNILHISQIPNFNGQHSGVPIYKTLEKS